MNVTKVSKSFNDYRLEISYGELEALRDAMSQHHSGPIGDELYAGLVWSLERLPRPGEDEDDDKEEKGNENLRSAANDLATPDELYGDNDEESSVSITSIADLDRELPGPDPDNFGPEPTPDEADAEEAPKAKRPKTA